MADRFFRSTTALALSVAMAVPHPAMAQDANAKPDIEKMTEAEREDAVDRCIKIAARQERRAEKGKAAKKKNGPWAAFCDSYLAGDFDNLLPAGIQSTAALAEASSDAPQEVTEQAKDGNGDGTAFETVTDGAAAKDGEKQAAAEEADAGAKAEEPSPEDVVEAETEPKPEAKVEAEAKSEIDSNQTKSADADATANENGETKPAEAANADETGKKAGGKRKNNAETAQNADAAQTGDALEKVEPAPAAKDEKPKAETETAQADDAAPKKRDGKRAKAKNPELKEMDSQAQADALATGDAFTAVAAADKGGAEADVTVREEVVTEETARSSDEEFATKVDDKAERKTTAESGKTSKADDDDDDGISDLGKVALLGLGAMAVGQLLNNGGRVVSNSGDRAVIEQNGQYRVLKNDDALLRQPGADVKTYSYDDGSARTVVTRQNGVEVETVRAADGRVLRRTRTLPDGRTVVLFDDTQEAEEVVVSELPTIETTRAESIDMERFDGETLASLLAAQEARQVGRRFSLSQIRNIDAVRYQVPEINVDTINFETGSAVIRPQEAEELSALGNALRNLIEENPDEVFLVEGHTDAVGAASYNLALSDRRAETVALALTEYFDVPPENLVVQGYGEVDLAVPTLEAERANRRAAVRRITPLLNGGDSL